MIKFNARFDLVRLRKDLYSNFSKEGVENSGVNAQRCRAVGQDT